MYHIFLLALIISVASSVDSLVAGFAYGVEKIKIKPHSIIVINLISVGVLGLTLTLSTLLGGVINSYIAVAVSSAMLIIIGLFKISESIIRNLTKNKNIEKNYNFSIFSLQFMLKIYNSPADADIDNSKELSIKETVALAIALSLDNVAVGLSAGLNVQGYTTILIIVPLALATSILFLVVGKVVGAKVAKKIKLNLSWVSGILLIGLAVFNMFL